jgi:lipid-binding SYLF domain-containing protein
MGRAGHLRAPLLVCVAVGILLMVAPDRSSALDLIDIQELVDESRLTLARFVEDPDMAWLRGHAKDAQAILIAPSIVRVSYVAGAAYGKAVLLVRDEQTGQWSDPAFFTLVGTGFGLQIGIARAEVVALVMTKRGIDSIVRNRFFLGPEIKLAVGPIGRAASGATTPTFSVDVVSFAKVRGAFAGVKLNGTFLFSDDVAHAMYYGGAFRSGDILGHPGRVQHWYSDRFRAMLNDLSKDEP